jgi:hypothetical protein
VPGELLKWYEKILAVELQGGTQITLLQNDDQPEVYGDRIGKVSLIRPANPAQTIALITNQEAGGPYQVSMQYAAVGAPGSRSRLATDTVGSRRECVPRGDRRRDGAVEGIVVGSVGDTARRAHRPAKKLLHFK